MNNDNVNNNINNNNVDNNTSNTSSQLNSVTLEPEKKRKYVEMQMPKLQTEQLVIENIKKEKKSILPYIIIIIIVCIIIILKSDDIISFINSFTEKDTTVIIEEKDTTEVMEGFISINSNDSNIMVDDIKFYNFKKDSLNSIVTYSYSSVKNVSNINDKNIYIELYDNDKNVLYRTKFNSDEIIYKGEVKTNAIEIDSYTYENISYVLVRNINETKEDTLTCSYKVSNENYNLVYINTYHFNNDFLVSYEVSKKIEVINENDESKQYIKDINSEYHAIKETDTNSTFNNNDLSYKIDLSNVKNDFTPIYDAKSSIIVIKNKEILKKWECE